MLSHQIFHHPKTQAGSNLTLGGEERLEDLVAVGAWDSRAIITEENSHPAAAAKLGSGGANANGAMLRHRVDAIAEQVGKDLPHFARSPRHLTVFGNLAANANLFVAEAGSEYAEHALQ